MYKTSADLINFRNRVASHATKGSRRGTVWWNVDDPDNFDPHMVADDLRSELREKVRLMGLARKEFEFVLEIQASAAVINDTPTLQAIRPSIRAFSKNIKKAMKEIAEIKHTLRALPKKLPPVLR